MTVVVPPAAQSSAPRPRGFRVSASLGFVLLGGAVSLYGPSIPILRETFGVSTSLAGMTLPVHSVASIAGILSWGALDGRGHARPALVLGATSTAAGAALVAIAPAFPAVLVGVAAIGFGLGALPAGLNALFARDRSAGAAARMNALHAMFGIGAVGFPVVLSVTSVTVAFLVLAALAIVTIPALRRAHDPGVLPRTDTSAVARRSARFLLLSFLLVFALYTGTELGAGNWMAAHLTDEGWSTAAAARWTAAYFLAFTVGRLLVARWAADQHPGRVVTTALGLAAGVALTAGIDGFTPYAYVLVGLVVAPAFPTGMVWLTRRLPEERHAPAGAMLAGSVGAAVFPGAVGGAVSLGGTDVVPLVVAGTAALGCLAAMRVRRTATAAADRR